MENRSKEVGLKVNIDKTKVSKQTRTRRLLENVIGDDYLEAVKHFKYLGTELTNDDDEEICRRITQANRAYFALSRIFRSRDIRRNDKIHIYKTIIGPIATYGCEISIITRKMANRINAFEQKVLRRIYGLTSENGLWRSKYNHELYQLYKNLPMIDFIRLHGLYWVGHVIKMDEQRTPRRILMGEMEGRRSKTQKEVAG